MGLILIATPILLIMYYLAFQNAFNQIPEIPSYDESKTSYELFEKRIKAEKKKQEIIRARIFLGSTLFGLALGYYVYSSMVAAGY